MTVQLPLGYLRQLQLGFLTERADVLRYVEESTSSGVTQTWATVATDVPCRVSQTGSVAAERPGDEAVLRAVSDWRIWLPFDADVTERDRIVVKAFDRSDERTFEVRRVDEKTNETARRCLVSLVT